MRQVQILVLVLMSIASGWCADLPTTPDRGDQPPVIELPALAELPSDASDTARDARLLALTRAQAGLAKAAAAQGADHGHDGSPEQGAGRDNRGGRTATPGNAGGNGSGGRAATPGGAGAGRGRGR